MTLNRSKVWRERRELLSYLESNPEVWGAMGSRRAEVIRTMAKNPEATLREMGEELGISGSAVRVHIEVARRRAGLLTDGN